MNDFLVFLCLLIMMVVGGLFLRQNLKVYENKEKKSLDFQRDGRSLAYNRTFFWEKLMELHNSDERRPSLLASSYEDDSEVSNSRECLLENTLSPSTGLALKRVRRGFRSYFYNYLDELAMAVCASIPAEGPGLNYAVRRTCGEQEILTCKQICTDGRLIQQSPKEVQKLSWTCAESLHVYKRQPALRDNYEEYTDSNKLGLAVYRHNSCSVGKCGPNYCCCRAFASAV